jgi:RNA polymerase sigma-70 factor (ECF subfamily)
MARFQSADAEAFTQLYRRYRGPVFSFVIRLGNSPERAADLTQETFLRLVRGADGFRHGSKVSTWIFTIARNVAIDSARRQQHRTHQSLDQPATDGSRPLGEQVSNPHPLADQSFTGKRLKEDLHLAIEQLPIEQKQVFLLREYYGHSFKEIAKIVNAKEGTIKSRMRYALEFLRRALASYEDYARTLQ